MKMNSTQYKCYYSTDKKVQKYSQSNWKVFSEEVRCADIT